jgi:hypothetical protein
VVAVLDPLVPATVKTETAETADLAWLLLDT